jgi:hypothetical protein
MMLVVDDAQLNENDSIGLSLLDTVDEMVRDGSLSGDLANVIMARVSPSFFRSSNV